MKSDTRMNRKLLKWVACGVVDSKNRLLLLKRTKEKEIYPEYWSIVAGGVVEKDPDPSFAAMREVAEETALKAKIIKEIKGFQIDQGDHKSMVYPFLFKTEKNGVKMNYEHTEYK